MRPARSCTARIACSSRMAGVRVKLAKLYPVDSEIF
jgi:hypothetical protein